MIKAFRIGGGGKEADSRIRLPRCEGWSGRTKPRVCSATTGFIEKSSSIPANRNSGAGENTSMATCVSGERECSFSAAIEGDQEAPSPPDPTEHPPKMGERRRARTSREKDYAGTVEFETDQDRALFSK